MKCVGLSAVAELDARVLILGTLPGSESLKQCRYYAKNPNSFWWVMGELLGSLPEDYEQRLGVLKKNSIALWDVCREAERSGSLDSRIVASTIVPNDFKSFLATHARIRLICFNGREAEKIFRRFDLLPDISQPRCEVLASTSPANTVARKEKLALWRKSVGEFINLVPSQAYGT